MPRDSQAERRSARAGDVPHGCDQIGDGTVFAWFSPTVNRRRDLLCGGESSIKDSLAFGDWLPTVTVRLLRYHRRRSDFLQSLTAASGCCSLWTRQPRQYSAFASDIRGFFMPDPDPAPAPIRARALLISALRRSISQCPDEFLDRVVSWLIQTIH